MMEDPDLIAILIPSDKEKRAENAFCLESNVERYLAPTQGTAEGRSISSRETTPASNAELEDDERKYDSTHRLELTFGEVPKDYATGFSFGTNPQKCDVLLGRRGAFGISGLHFGVTFDVASDGKPRLVLRDSSTNGMAVSYNGQARKEVRHHFTWILNLEKEEGEWDVEVHVRGLRFKVELASHDACKVQYDRNVAEFMEFGRTALPLLNVLGMESHPTTAQASQALTPKRLPVYIYEKTLGRGAFGQVDKVIDVSTGAVYARKTFFAQRDREDWLEDVRKEIRIMREYPHEFTVALVDAREDSDPFVVMPYFPLGSVEDLQETTSPVTGEESVILLHQSLLALEFLHSCGVAHRDLKPANILLEYRYPFTIKLADFGLASDRPDLKTFCGTRRYLAPEVYTLQSYTASVDLWSLGVIVLQLAYGFPLDPDEQGTRDWGKAWCDRLVHHAKIREPDTLINLLIGMLRIVPFERLSASECLRQGREVELFFDDDDLFGSGGTTPTRATVAQDETGDDAGLVSPTLSALLDTTGEESIERNSTGRWTPYPGSGRS